MKLITHPLTGWLVAILLAALVWLFMDYRVVIAQRNAAQMAATVTQQSNNITALEQSLAEQNAAIHRVAQQASEHNQQANARAERVLHVYTTRPADITQGPEELNQWLQNLFAAPSPSAALVAPRAL
jgi:Flp pilus assembly protein TadG